jgi:hypothetical protein
VSSTLNLNKDDEALKERETDQLCCYIIKIINDELWWWFSQHFQTTLLAMSFDCENVHYCFPNERSEVKYTTNSPLRSVAKVTPPKAIGVI